MDPVEIFLASGPGRRMNPDGSYGLQCVDVVDQYGQDLFGVRWQDCVGGVNGARQLLDVMPREYWSITWNDPNNAALLPSRGDVLVFDGDGYNEFGHTGVTLHATQAWVDMLQQDGFAPPTKFVDGGWYSDKATTVARLAYSQQYTGPLKGWATPRREKFAPQYLNLGNINPGAGPAAPRELLIRGVRHLYV